MPMYKLKRRFYDGERVHAIDDVLEFEAGKQPASAVPVKVKEKKVVQEYEDILGESDVSVEDAQPGDTLSSLVKKGK